MELSVPTSRDFLLVLDPEKKTLSRAASNVAPGDNTVQVSFRQGTTRDDAERATYLARRKIMFDSISKQMVEISEVSQDELSRIEVSLSLTGTNLNLPGGVPLKFKSDFGITSVADLTQFSVWWGLLIPQWAGEIYSCCLEVNPDWGSKSSGI